MPDRSPDIAGMVYNIMRFSLHDGPGIRTTVFLKGCPLACPWCHNPESIRRESEIILREERCIQCGECVDACTHGAVIRDDGRVNTDRALCVRCGECVPHCYAGAREVAGKEMTTGSVLDEVVRDRVFFDESGGGVTFSGGEPLLQHEFLASLLQASRQREIHTVVDTTGCASPVILERIAPLVDLFLYDLKLMDDAKHREYTGVSNILLLENMRRLVQWGKQVIVRIPLIPGINDDPRNIRASGEWLASLPAIREIHLLPYHAAGSEKYVRLGKPYALGALRSPDGSATDRIAAEFQKYVPLVILGG
jgi:pyruvate formate lyase activating enzyme